MKSYNIICRYTRNMNLVRMRGRSNRADSDWDRDNRNDAGFLWISSYHGGVSDMPIGELGGLTRRRDEQTYSTSTLATLSTFVERREH